MRRIILLLLVLILVGWRIIDSLTSEPAPTGLSDEQKAAVADTVSALMVDEFIGSTDPVDFERIMSLIHDAPETAMAFEGGMLHGYATMEAVFGEHFSSVSREPSTITDSAAVVLGPDMVYVMRSGTFVSIDTAGTASPMLPWAQTMLWVRRDGVWKVLLGHISHGPPMEQISE